ncbi:nicotinate phosphoribosyltransferase isoform X7 [Camelus ferus]|uniref:Nicotinate phosphoribosyltransferase n=2 Tax=Camelus TaxID=9836 RepID=A0A8B8S035_CAMFR|nr:nicotinate phosphoribosyltransferase isoform X7 [Camelus ferus]
MAAEQDAEGRAAARPLLTDLYQATMALGYWRAGRAQDQAEFELFFRRCPFGGAFALAAGLRDCVRFLRTFRLRDAGAAAASVGATPGGAAAGNAAPLPGQLCQMLAPAAGQGPTVDLAASVETWLERVCAHLGLGVQEPHRGERAAFVAYALAFPRAFQGLLDTYSVRRSGLPNFLAVALALEGLGYQAVGVRLDSGDLLQQAQEIRGVFRTVAAQFRVPWLESVPITVSNSIDEEELARLAQKGSEVNGIGIGTSVVTCPRQPSLGCVYKLVSVGGQPRMKLTEDPEKQTLPGSKAAFRLLGSNGSLLMDVLQLAEEPPPQAGQELRVWPRGAQESCTVRPAHVEPLLRLWVQQGQLCEPLPSLAESRAFAQLSLSRLSPAHRRLEQPELYQVALSEKLQALVDKLSASSPRESPMVGAA